MNKKELISAVAERTNLSKKDVELTFGAIFDTIKDVLATRKKISIKGFGTFSVKDRKAKTGRHPRTGKTLQIPARIVPVFKAGSQLKDVISGEDTGKKAAAPKKKAAAPKKKAAAPKKKAAAPKKKAAAPKKAASKKK